MLRPQRIGRAVESLDRSAQAAARPRHDARGHSTNGDALATLSYDQSRRRATAAPAKLTFT
jgi:hypothetical protein